MTIRRRWFAAAPLALLLGTAAVIAQAPGGGYNVVPAPPRVNVQDKEDTWVLDFQFKSPRVLTVDIPGRGRKTVWYVRYEVWNRTGAPRYFIPDFRLIAGDKVFHDQVMPKVQEEIARTEDPTGFYKIKDSVTIAAKPIPPSKPDANPIYVTGVAIFPDVVETIPDVTQFIIQVIGLSNGWQEDPNTHLIRRKTLQLNF
ncbi:MAG TPA: hypothetical protein VGF55_21795, partial [Gemmataceae bacterium]